MSWLRLDDNFAQHPKFEGWPAAQRWAFVELMLYCAKYRTGGRVPADLTLLPRPVNSRLLGQAEASGWLDRTEEALWIHDWEKYNPSDPTAAERQKRYRDRNAERNEQRDDNGASRVGAHARPVPSPTPEQPPAEKKVLSAEGSETTETLPIDKELQTQTLLRAIGSCSDNTAATVRALVNRLPEASVAKVQESLLSQGSIRDREAYAVGALRSEFAEMAGRA